MTIVFTNGVFDIIHGGHISLLKYARSLGDCLMIGINSDSSVKRLKGPTRPIQHESTRFAILKELRCVDEVILFYEDTPEKLIQSIKPNVLVKGPEANNLAIPGADFVLSMGGKVITPDWPITESTTKIISKIRKLYDKTVQSRY